MSIQDAKCPVFDMYKDIKYEGIHQTMNIKGAVTIRRKDFQGSQGFFVVLVAHPDDTECGQSHSALPSPLTAREKPNADANIETKVTVLVRDGLGWKGYTKAAWGAIGVLLLLAVILLAMQMALNRYGTIAKYCFDGNFRVMKQMIKIKSMYNLMQIDMYHITSKQSAFLEDRKNYENQGGHKGVLQ
ncbi:unnamed protein product [Acanthoscelides obtectus]|uniref:Uncharacterized protein n=1 Tax=Acanthoscelides obtectus TaxID=200917 RepID=A0A9P0QJ33_ACAOB|nr:unnamed protein product [Acanthoscelides obtectus]CAK1685529.1 SID1 transmembrane family member 2 [Acanthoscelides obtectus]